MASVEDTRTVEVKCYCGGVHFNLDIPVVDLPLKAYLCHCNICRYNTGKLANMHANMNKGVGPKWIAPSSINSLATYQVPGVDYTTKSCGTCGSHVGTIGIDDGTWTLATALFGEHGPDVVNVVSHVFSKSAGGDGGLASILTHIRGEALPSWNPNDDAPIAAATISEPDIGASGQQRLRAQCHCGGVSFTVPRPTKSMAEHAFAKHFVSPLDHTKWYGLFDVCDDCRLTSGTPVASWIFVPLSFIEPAVGEDLRIGTTKTYASSEGVTRAFCSICSATVFFLYHSRRYNDVPIVNVSTGLLRAPEGSMAQNWVTWWKKASFEADGLAFDKDLAEGVFEGMKKWTAERNEG